MDPDVTYTKLKEAAEEWERLSNTVPLKGDADRKQWADGLTAAGDTMAEAFAALDEWLKLGGHAPAAWDQRMRSRP